MEGRKLGIMGLTARNGYRNSWYEGVKGNNGIGRVKWGQGWEGRVDDRVWWWIINTTDL